jgi:ribosomal protein L7/L12
MPLEKARALAKELTTDLENYDKEQAEKARRELEDADAE